MKTVGIRENFPSSAVSWPSDPVQMSRGSGDRLVSGRCRAMPALWVLVLVMLAAVVPGVSASSHAAAAPSGVSAVSAGFEYYCFNKRGVFKTGTRIALADWNRDGRTDECFGIAPDRRIYHAWPASNGWDPMPNNGLADNMANPGWNVADITGGGQLRSAHVLVNGKGLYFSCLDTGPQSPKKWSPWSQRGCI